MSNVLLYQLPGALCVAKRSLIVIKSTQMRFMWVHNNRTFAHDH